MLGPQAKKSADAVLRSGQDVPFVSDPFDAAECPGADAVRRATEFIMGRLGEHLSVGRIARASGLSVRTLHRIIRREYGVSPMVLLRRARLARARTDLESPRLGTTVTQTALHWGFPHLGRFSGEYARHFGEPPSDTLRRARRALVGAAVEANVTSSGATFGGASAPVASDRKRTGAAHAPAAFPHDAIAS